LPDNFLLYRKSVT